MTEPTKQMIVTKSVGQLSEDERERLAEIVEWYECPVCHGEAPQFDMGKFCIACTDRGKLLSPTANIVAAMLNLRWMPPEAADEITTLRDRVAALEGANRKLRREVGDGQYMLESYRQMLGPKGRQVAKMWADQGLIRQHSSWAVDPYTLTGEEIAAVHLEWEAAPKTQIDDVDAILSRAQQGGGDADHS